MTDSQMEIMIAARQLQSLKWRGAFRIVIAASDPEREPGMDSICECTEEFDTEPEALNHARMHADEYTKLCVVIGILDPSVMLVDFSTISQN